MPSSVIRRFRYDAVGQRLTVTFTSGAVYAYLDVPPKVAAALDQAESQGRLFGEAGTLLGILLTNLVVGAAAALWVLRATAPPMAVGLATSPVPER